jgi:hypothetical protein
MESPSKYTLSQYSQIILNCAANVFEAQSDEGSFDIRCEEVEELAAHYKESDYRFLPKTFIKAVQAQLKKMNAKGAI